jgi:hypothetical protein
MGCRNFEAVRKNAFLFYAINFACYSDGKPYEPPDSFHYFGADPDFDRLLSVARYRHYLRRPKAFLEFLARGLFAPHFAAIVCSFTQAHTASLSSSVSFASGCITAYVRGGILPVDMSPHMDSNLSRFCRIEYVSHSEKSSCFLPSRTCLAIHQEIGASWLYQGQSV